MREGGVIINADASQVYADLRIVTARPTVADEAAAPHRLYGIADAADPWSAARWAAAARAEVERAWAGGAVPILVGGTGLYLRALLQGVAAVPEIDPDIRANIRALPLAEARAALEAEDPGAAARLHPNDTQRTLRALEVVRATGRTLASWQADGSSGLANAADVIGELIAPSRDVLTARADARVDAMLAEGALDEVAALAARRPPETVPAMRAIGVPPLIAHIRGVLDLEQAVTRWKLDTRQYIKRQSTWFRNQRADLVDDVS